jgi:hypothetical protein
MTPTDMVSHLTFPTIDDTTVSVILNSDHPFIKWLIALSNSLKYWDKRTLVLENGIKDSLNITYQKQFVLDTEVTNGTWND